MVRSGCFGGRDVYIGVEGVALTQKKPHQNSSFSTAFLSGRGHTRVSLSRISLRHDGDDGDGVRHLRGGDDGQGVLPNLRAFR